MVRPAVAQKRPPLDLSARMAVCDANYLRLLKLLPEFTTGLRHTILLPAVHPQESSAAQRLDIHVVESFRYTSTVHLSLVVEERAPSWYRAPQLTVRIYHDAGTAEVVTYQDQLAFKAIYSDNDAPRFSWDEKNQINLFLADWLSLCLEGGLSCLALPACLHGMQVATESSMAAGD
ncbi:MAG: DUF1249 domain-containing protein [Pseudomonadota bacterium]